MGDRGPGEREAPERPGLAGLGPRAQPPPSSLPEQASLLRGRGCRVFIRPFPAYVFLFQVGDLAGPVKAREA